MDIKGMLNEDRRGDKHPRRQGPPHSKPPSLPSLNTSNDRSILNESNASAGTPYPHQNFSNHAHSAQSPTLPQQPRPDPPFTPTFGSNNRPPSSSQYPHPNSVVSTPTPLSAASNVGSYQQPLQPPPPRSSLSRSPSSSHAHGGYIVNRSPAPAQNYAQQSPIAQPSYLPKQIHPSQSHSPPSTPSGHTQAAAWGRELSFVVQSPSRPDAQVHIQSAQSAQRSPALVVSRRNSLASQPPNTPPVPRQVSLGHSSLGERDKSESVSPKTVVASLPQHNSKSNSQMVSDPYKSTATPSGYIYDSARDLQSPIQMHDVKQEANATDYFATQNSSKDPKSLEQTRQQQSKAEPKVVQSSQTPTFVPETMSNVSPATSKATPSVDGQDASQSAMSEIEKSRVSSSPGVVRQAEEQNVRPNSLKRRLDANLNSEESQAQPAAKKLRFKEPPIWAQRAKHTTPLPKYRGQRALKAKQQPLNGQAHPAGAKADASPQKGASTWEPSFTNLIPHEELTRAISHFLFMNVVTNNALENAQVGSLEIEAKLGRIIDKRTRERLRLPIQTEALIDESLDVAFESFMTENHHKRFNEFLNQAVAQSQVKPRIKMQYVHTRETDSFFYLPQEEISNLPPAVQAAAPSGQKLRLRVTKDQKTGATLAKIIKARLKDLHVYSPRTEFDWRISVSFELNWTGDLEALAASEEGYKIPDRNKDRVSYRHQFTQIDLTQVKPTAGQGTDEATHELEVELDSAEVKKQGKLAMEGKETQYEDLVKSFADNVRILARHCSGPR